MRDKYEFFKEIEDDMKRSCVHGEKNCGMCRSEHHYRNCRATCNCKHKLHRHF